ncbi:MAG TPA: site-2 protease family protein [Euryarchaeota archaeon]|nr:site-2 protease family protein [Euryarchaeota archaeon]
MLSSREVVDLVASWVTISVAFSVVANPSNPLAVLPLYLVVVGTAFIFHELAHKYAAIHLGYHAEYRLWTAGLVFALLLAFTTGFVFAAPGAVYVAGLPNRRDNGIISIAGPLANFVIASFALLALLLLQPGYFLFRILYSIFHVNAFIGFFNMLPLPPLDGSKVLEWSAAAYVSLLVPLAFYVFFL